MFHANSFLSLTNRPTRIKKESATLIDNIFTNGYIDLENASQCLIYTDIIDHFPIIYADFITKKRKMIYFGKKKHIWEK